MEREVEVVEMRSEAEKGKRAVMAVMAARILVLVVLVVLVALVVLAVVVSLAELAVVVVPVVVVAMAVTMVATMVATTVTAAATAATVIVVAAQREAQGCRQPVSTPFDDKVLGSYAFVLVRHRYHVQPKIPNNKNEKRKYLMLCCKSDSGRICEKDSCKKQNSTVAMKRGV